jgi:hypothetical protein
MTTRPCAIFWSSSFALVLPVYVPEALGPGFT